MGLRSQMAITKLFQCDYMYKLEDGVSDHGMVIVTIPLNERMTKQSQFVRIPDYENAALSLFFRIACMLRDGC